MNIRRIVDVLMTAALMLLMSSQVTEQTAHEYIGIAMFTLFIIHQYLNRRWYGALLRGKYTLLRSLSTVINFSLLASFITTAFSGIIMSENFPALNIESLTSFARLAPLSCSYLSFVLMGIHLGLHWGMIAGRVKSLWPEVAAVLFSGWGLFAFVDAGIFSYITLANQFAFLDYDKTPVLVILENMAMLSFWTLLGYQVSKMIAGKFRKPLFVLTVVFTVFGVLRLYIFPPSQVMF